MLKRHGELFMADSVYEYSEPVHPRPHAESIDWSLPISAAPKQNGSQRSISRSPVSAGKGHFYGARTAYKYVAAIFQEIVLMEYGTRAF